MSDLSPMLSIGLTGEEPLLSMTASDLYKIILESGWQRFLTRYSTPWGTRYEYVFRDSIPESILEHFIWLESAYGLVRHKREGYSVTFYVSEDQYYEHLAITRPKLAREFAEGGCNCVNEDAPGTECNPGCVRLRAIQKNKEALVEAWGKK